MSSGHAQLSDGSTWPLPDPDLGWTLTYGKPTREDLLRAASLISAYGYLITETTRDRRALVFREIRAKLDGQASDA